MEAEALGNDLCNGQLCFRVSPDQRRLQVVSSHPCPFILARYGKEDPCRCCAECEKSCSDAIKDPHA